MGQNPGRAETPGRKDSNMITYNSGTVFGSGTTGTRALVLLPALGLVPQPGLGLVACETRMERPAGLSPEAEFLSLAAPLDAIGPSRAYHGDLPPEVRALPGTFFTQNTVAGAGHMPGVGAVACAWAESKRLRARRAALREGYGALGRNTMPLIGFEPVEVHFLSAGGGTGPAHTIHHVSARLRAAEAIDQYVYALAPLAGNGKEYTERAGAAAFLLALTLGLGDPACPSWRARVVPFLFNGAAGDYEALTQAMARDGLNRMQSAMIEDLVGDLRDYQAGAVGAARTVTAADGAPVTEIPRFINVVTVRTIFVPRIVWTEKWVTALAADSARYLLGTDGDGLTGGEVSAPEGAAVTAEAAALLGRVLSPNERAETLAENLYGRANGDRTQAAAAWVAESRRLMENNREALTARYRERAEREAQATGMPSPLRQMEALRRAAHRAAAMAAHLQGQAEAQATALDEARATLAWNASAAGHGQPGSATVLRRAECVLLRDEVAAEIAPVLARLLDDTAARLREEAEVTEASTAAAALWVDGLEDAARRRAEDYHLALTGGGLRLALPIDDDVYGPGGHRGGPSVPLARRRALAARVVASRTRDRLAAEGVAATDFGRLGAILEEEARRAIPDAPTVWALLEREPALMERAARCLDVPPSGLDGARLEVYGHARVGLYVEIAARFHGAARQVRGLGAFKPFDSGDEFELRLRRVDWAVPLMALDWFRAGMAAYGSLREQEGAALRCTLPWREAEILRLWEQASSFDEVIFSGTAAAYAAPKGGGDDSSGNDGRDGGQGSDGPGAGSGGPAPPEQDERRSGAVQAGDSVSGRPVPAALGAALRNGTGGAAHGPEGGRAAGGREAVLARRHAGDRSLRRSDPGRRPRQGD